MQIAEEQCNFIEKTAWFQPQPFYQNTHKSDDRAVNWRSRSFKVIKFCCNRKPICDFLLLINCHLSSISHSFRDIASRSQKPPQLSLSLPIKGNPSNFLIKLGLHFNENCIILASVGWSIYAYHGRHSNKLTFKVIQGHRLLLQSKAYMWLPISDLLSPKLYLAPFPRYSVANSETTPPQFESPDQGDPFEFCNQTWQARS